MWNKKIFFKFKKREDKQQKQASWPPKPQHVPRAKPEKFWTKVNGNFSALVWHIGINKYMHLLFFMSWILCHIIITTGVCTSAYIFCVLNYFGLRKTRPDWGISWIVLFHAWGNKQASFVGIVQEAVWGGAGSGNWGLPRDGKPVTSGLCRLCPGLRRRALANLAS